MWIAFHISMKSMYETDSVCMVMNFSKYIINMFASYCDIDCAQCELAYL